MFPERQLHKHDKKANRFEKGLSDFINRTLKRSFESFKDQSDEAQTLRKRAVIQLISCTMAGRKKMFNRWIVLTERSNIIAKCKKLSNIVSQLNLVIKSVADNAFVNNQQSNLKEKALIRMFAAFRAGAGDSFNRWRELNTLEKLKGSMNQTQKKFILGLLENMLRNNKINKLR